MLSFLITQVVKIKINKNSTEEQLELVHINFQEVIMFSACQVKYVTKPLISVDTLFCKMEAKTKTFPLTFLFYLSILFYFIAT